MTNPSSIDSPLGSRRARLLPLLVLVIGAAVLLPRLGAYGLWDPTEVKIADAARALSQPHGRGAAPPSMTILMVAEGFKAMGVGEVGGRLPLALLSLLTLLIAYFVGRATLRPRAAFLGAIALVTMPSFLFGARQLTSGVPLLLASAVSVGGLVYLLWPPKGTNAAVRVLGFVAAAAGIYLGIRSGGVLVGGIAPLTAVLLAYRAARSTRLRLHRENEGLDGPTLIAAILISLAGGFCVVLGFMAWRTHGIHSFWMNGVPHAIQYQTVVTSLLRSLGFATAPWLALIPFALLRSLDGQMPAREDDEEDRAVFARTLWPAVLTTTYFTATLQASAVGDLLVPGAIAVALLCGAYLDDFLERPALRALEGVAVIMLVIVLGHDVLLTTDAFVSVQSLDLIRWPTQVNYTANVLFGIMALFGLLAGGALLLPAIGPLADGPRRQRVQRVLLLGAVGVQLVFAVMVVQWLIPTASKHLSPKDLYGKTKQLDPKAALGQYHFNATGASYYMGGRTATPLNTLDELLNFLRRPERVFVFVGSEDLASIDQAARERQVLPPPLNAPPANPLPANPPPPLKRSAPGTLAPDAAGSEAERPRRVARTAVRRRRARAATRNHLLRRRRFELALPHPVEPPRPRRARSQPAAPPPQHDRAQAEDAAQRELRRQAAVPRLRPAARSAARRGRHGAPLLQGARARRRHVQDLHPLRRPGRARQRRSRPARRALPDPVLDARHLCHRRISAQARSRDAAEGPVPALLRSLQW